MIDLVALLAGGQDDVVTGVLAAAGNDDLRGLIGQAVLLFELVGDGLAQLGDAAGGRVLGEPVIEGLDRRILDVLRGVEIGLPRAKTDHVQPLRLHLLGLGIDGQREGRGERGGALRNLVVHHGLTNTIGPPERKREFSGKPRHGR